MCQLVTLDFDLVSAAVMFESFVTSIFFACLYYKLILEHPKVQKAFLYLEEDWKFFKDDAERKIIQRYDCDSKIFPLTFGSACVFFLAYNALPPILRIIISNDKGLSSTDPFPISTCFDYFLDREIYYYPVFIQQSIFITIGVLGAITGYSIFFGYIYHICARFSIIITKIHRPFTHNDYNNNISIEPMDLSDWMIDIIQHLARTKEFTNLVNELSGNCYLFQVLLIFLHIIVDFIYFFQIPTLLERDGGKRDACLLIFIIAGSLFPLSVNSYVGQKLIDRSTNMYIELCAIPIYKISLKTQKLLLTAILMSEKPSTILIGKFFVSSHEFFSNVIRSALSFAVMANKMQNI